MKKKLSSLIKNHAPNLAHAIRIYRSEKRQDKPYATHPEGFKFKGNKAMEEGVFEVEEVELFRQLIDSVDRIVNVGANIGYYTCLGAHRGKPVIAFEPIPENAKVLQENIYVNEWKHVEVFPLALGESPGILPMFGTGTGASLVEGWAGIPSSDRRFIPVNSMNNVLGNRRNIANERLLFWVDVEGFEFNVLSGADDLLTRNADDIWVVEICIDEHMPTGIQINPKLLEIFQVFWKNKFISCEAIKTLPLVEQSHIEEIVRTGNNILNTHNFVFMNRDRRESILSEET